MRRHPIRPLLLALCRARLALAQTAAPVAILDVNVVDVVKAETRAHQTVLIANGRIAAIDASDAVAVPRRPSAYPEKAAISSPASGICTSICAAMRASPMFLWL